MHMHMHMHMLIAMTSCSIEFVIMGKTLFLEPNAVKQKIYGSPMESMGDSGGRMVVPLP